MSRVQSQKRSIRSHLVFGVASVAFLLVGVGGWASTTELSGAVIAPGMLVVDSSVKKVQHPTGGVVGQLNVRDGDLVRAGDVLVRLDDTVTRANLAIVTKNLDELAARRARDEAERDGGAAVAFPPDLLERAAAEPEVARLVEGETRLFEIRRASREGQRAMLRERVSQLSKQTEGLTQQAEAKRREIELIAPELAGVRDLWSKGLIQIGRVNALERDATRLQGERGQLLASMAEVRGKTAEIELQILQIDADMRSEVSKDIAEIRGRYSEYVERRISAEDQLKRIDIRSPQDGTVHQLSVHTVGGVVAPNGEPLMMIVPVSDLLRVEARISPQDVDQLHVGQHAVLRFSNFNQRTTPELNAAVSLVSPDVSLDPKTGSTFYTIHIRIPADELARLGGLKLVPGMPVEAFVQTGSRTVISYLTRPLQDQIMRAFREK